MKLIGVMNGWRDAPHLWWRFILLPLGMDNIPGHWRSVSLFGFTFFFDAKEK